MQALAARTPAAFLQRPPLAGLAGIVQQAVGAAQPQQQPQPQAAAAALAEAGRAPAAQPAMQPPKPFPGAFGPAINSSLQRSASHQVREQDFVCARQLSSLRYRLVRSVAYTANFHMNGRLVLWFKAFNEIPLHSYRLLGSSVRHVITLGCSECMGISGTPRKTFRMHPHPWGTQTANLTLHIDDSEQ